MTRLDEIVEQVNLVCTPSRKSVFATNRRVYERAHRLAVSKGVKIASVGATLIVEWLRQGADESIIRSDIPIGKADSMGFSFVLPDGIKQALDEVRANSPNFTMQPLINTLLMAWCDANGAPEITLEPVKPREPKLKKEPKQTKLSIRISRTVQTKAQVLADGQGIHLNQLCGDLLTGWVEEGEDESRVKQHPVGERVHSQPRGVYVALDVMQKLRASAKSKGFTLGDLMTSLLEQWCAEQE